MKLLCKIDSDEKIEIQDAKIIYLDNNKEFTYTFWNQVKPLMNFYSNAGVDILYLSLFVFAADRLFLRNNATDSWSRDLELYIPVLESTKWNELANEVEEMLCFLSGDKWRLHFRERKLTVVEVGYRKKYDKQKRERKSFNTLCMLSGGLDSCIGAIDLLETLDCSKVLFISHHGGGKGTKEYQDLLKDQFIMNYGVGKDQFYQNYAAVKDGVEDTTRTRSFMFFAHALAYATAMEENVTLVIPENGLISLNVPLTHTRLGSSSTRTTHPNYMGKLQNLIFKLGIAVKINNPFQFKTKGEMIYECKNRDLLQQNIQNTMSCSHPDVGRYKGINKPLHCGYCLPCTIRKAAIQRGQLTETSEYFINDYKGNKVARESMNTYKLAMANFNPQVAFLKIQCSGPIEENIMEYADLYKRGIVEMKTYLEEYDV